MIDFLTNVFAGALLITAGILIAASVIMLGINVLEYIGVDSNRAFGVFLFVVGGLGFSYATGRAFMENMES